MKIIKERAVVLDCININRSDKLITFYGDNNGLIKGVAEGSRLIKSRFLGCLELMNIIDISYFYRENKDLVNIRECEIISSVSRVGESPEYYFFIFYICELAKEFATSGIQNVVFFNILKDINRGIKERIRFNILARWAEIQFLREHGVFSYLKICTSCRKDISNFSELKYINKDGELKCKACSKSSDTLIGNHLFKLMNELLYAKIGQLNIMEIKEKELKEIGRILKEIIQNHLQKSLKFYNFYKKTMLSIEDKLSQ